MNASAFCPCGNPQPYPTCCGRYHAGNAVAPTAEALMRSRYTAYYQGNVDYLLATRHPDKRRFDDRIQLLNSMTNTRWVRLQVLATKQGQPGDAVGYVEFVAVYQAPELGQLHESSKFTQIEGRWFYQDGTILPPYRPKRNDPCWCGSGKKFKQCHG